MSNQNENVPNLNAGEVGYEMMKPADEIETTEAPSSSSSSSCPPPSEISRDELTELVRAVKFAMPDASQRDVFKEITEVIATKDDGRYSFLKDAVQLNDVKKVWKKASQPRQQHQGDGEGSSLVDNSDLAEKLKIQGGVPQVFTVGVTTGSSSNSSSTNNDNDARQLSTVQVLAQDYVSVFLTEQASKSAREASEIAKDYVHVYLDVPADRSGTRPHQALINFQQKPRPASTTSSGNGGGKGKNKGKKGKKQQAGGTSLTNTSESSADLVVDAPFDDAIIVKVQKAAPLHAHDTTKYPMLVYDQTKTYKTFIHYDDTIDVSEGSKSDSDSNDIAAASQDQGYDKIASWILKSGTGGALGAAGGTKSYFFGRLSKTSGKGPDILSIYIKSLAPAQEW